MRAYDNGCFFTVTYSRNDAESFSDRWPCSTVRGAGSFQFSKRNGDLVDLTGSAAKSDGPEWVAFSEDCQRYGEKRLKLNTGHFNQPAFQR
jgi:hypothetical protein